MNIFHPMLVIIFFFSFVKLSSSETSTSYESSSEGSTCDELINNSTKLVNLPLHAETDYQDLDIKSILNNWLFIKFT